MSWQYTVVLGIVAVCLMATTGALLYFVVTTNRRLMRVIYARPDYARLEARELKGPELGEGGIPPGMMT